MDTISIVNARVLASHTTIATVIVKNGVYVSKNPWLYNLIVQIQSRAIHE